MVRLRVQRQLSLIQRSAIELGKDSVWEKCGASASLLRECGRRRMLYIAKCISLYKQLSYMMTKTRNLGTFDRKQTMSVRCMSLN